MRLKIKKIFRCLQGRINLTFKSIFPRVKKEKALNISRALKQKNKIITLSYWDTREKFRNSWEFNQKIIKHNFKVFYKNLPDNYFLENLIFCTRGKKIHNIPNEKLARYRKDHYNYISHTINQNPVWKYFKHNAAVQKGFLE